MTRKMKQKETKVATGVTAVVSWDFPTDDTRLMVSFSAPGMSSMIHMTRQGAHDLAMLLIEASKGALPPPAGHCNCERPCCESHVAGECRIVPGKAKAMYVGAICDTCALKTSYEYLTVDVDGRDVSR